MLTKDKWLALFSMATYGFSIYILKHIPTTYVHFLSGTFVILYALFMTKYMQEVTKNKWYLFFAGVCFSLAAHTHEEFLLLSVHLGLCIAIKRLDNPWGINGYWFKFKEYFPELLYGALGSILPIVFWILYFKPATVTKYLAMNVRLHTSSHTGSIFDIATISIQFLRENNPFSIMFFFVLGIIIYPLLREGLNKADKKRLLNNFSLGLAPVVYLVIYSLKIGKTNLSRLFMPMQPMVIIFAIYVMYILAKKYTKSKLFARVVVLVIVASSIHINQPWHYLKKQVSIHRKEYDKISEFVKNDEKILVSLGVESRGMMWGNSPAYGLLGKMYFGEQASSIYNEFIKNESTLDEMIKNTNTKFIYVSNTRSGYKRLDIEKYFNKLYSVDIKKIVNRYSKELSEQIINPSSQKLYIEIDTLMLKKYLVNMGAEVIFDDSIGALYKVD